jgi:hypothetical protein
MVQLQDSILKRLYHHTLFSMLSDGISEAHHAHILSCYGPKVGHWLTTQPIFPSFQLPFPTFSTTLHMQLRLPHPSFASILQCVCTHPINLMVPSTLWVSTFYVVFMATNALEPMMQLATPLHLLHEMLTSMWDENNYMRFLQPHLNRKERSRSIISPESLRH